MVINCGLVKRYEPGKKRREGLPCREDGNCHQADSPTPPPVDFETFLEEKRRDQSAR